MPNFDGGHYALTALVPILQDTLIEHNGLKQSPIQMVRGALALLPTALQTPATERMGLNSPFARTTRTHFARFAVIDQVMYNGRDRTNPVTTYLRNQHLTLPQPQDSLSCSFLVFIADFDAKSGDVSELTSYLTDLWSTMEAELRACLRYCVGFDAVRDAASFARYIERCQVETTMPFNDYWTTPPPLRSLTRSIATMVPAWAASLAGLAWFLTRGGPWSVTLPAVLGGLGAGLATGAWLGYTIFMVWAQRPFPTAPDSDLPSILKALYLQPRFTELVIDHQAKSEQDLYDAFGAFIAAHRPADTTSPTQAPGVIQS